MALDVLSRMKKGKRIVITPGMIELGDKQHYHNANFGEHIAKCCDIAIIVGQYNRNAILEGISRDKSFPQENVIVVDRSIRKRPARHFQIDKTNKRI